MMTDSLQVSAVAVPVGTAGLQGTPQHARHVSGACNSVCVCALACAYVCVCVCVCVCKAGTAMV